MQDRTKIWMARLAMPALLVGALGASIYWGNGYRVEAVTYERHLDGLYQKSFSELTVNMAEIESALAKLMVVTTPQQYTSLLGQACRSSEAAATVLAQIPGAYEDYAPLNKFLSEMGDYCSTLVKGSVAGTPVSPQDKDQLAQLHNTCAQLNQELREHVESGMAAYFLENIAEEGGYFSDEGGAISFKAEEGQEKYPQLIYDGPFSDSTLKAQPQGLPPEEVDENIAMQEAQNFLGDMAHGALERIDDENGRVPAYGFSGQTPDGGAIEIYITKQGAKPLWMRIQYPDAAHADIKPSPEEGTALGEKGLEFLNARGYGSMISTYAQFYGGEAIVNYAFVQDGAVLYNDLIKVWLDVETGRVTGMDATNYWFSHVPRSFPADLLPVEQAQQYVSDSLEIAQVRTAFIPVTPSEERLCYEFKGTFGGSSYIVYINAVTGAEEDVFLIIDSENGQLVL